MAISEPGASNPSPGDTLLIADANVRFRPEADMIRSALERGLSVGEPRNDLLARAMVSPLRPSADGPVARVGGVLQHYVRIRHPAEFVALGEPSFRIGKGQFLRIAAYIYRRRHTAVGNPRLSFVCDAMAICLTTVLGLYIYAYFTLPGG